MLAALCAASICLQAPPLVDGNSPPIPNPSAFPWDLEQARRLPVEPAGFSDVVFDPRGMGAWLSLDDGRIWTVDSRGELQGKTKLPEPWDLEALCPTPDGLFLIGLEEKLGQLLVLETDELRYLRSLDLPGTIPHGRKGPEGLWILEPELRPGKASPRWELVIGNQNGDSLHFCPWGGVDQEPTWRGMVRMGDEPRGLCAFGPGRLLAVMDDKHELWSLLLSGSTQWSVPLPKRLKGVEGVALAPDGSLWLVEDEGGLWSCPPKPHRSLPWARMPTPPGYAVDGSWSLDSEHGRLLGPENKQALQWQQDSGRWSAQILPAGAPAPPWSSALQVNTMTGSRRLPGDGQDREVSFSLRFSVNGGEWLAVVTDGQLGLFPLEAGQAPDWTFAWHSLEAHDQVLGFSASPAGPALALHKPHGALQLILLGDLASPTESGRRDR